ncbi:Rrf2 family transcriptional regulator [Cupriavidus basilensis]|uniref:Rrf2 family transcriptional regulator n=1 Tax=Cupriavidus basilensis TaxID=68895 RepID=A0ABT6AV96_9BURK|nr:Rrf2 family transcriptional regulator [Cupriavidus basilensis]MDF3836552.1 Rrf2 family transcriptional regulator [Cupriavidus basilensis]
MRLTDYTDYSLRTLIYVAVHPGELVTIQRVADAFGIPKNHLIKIVQKLGQAGFLHTVRGRAGGIELGRPAAGINVGEVIRTMESDFHLVECFQGDDNHCIITRVCGLRGVLSAALRAYFEVLDAYTLQDLVEKPAALNRALGQGEAASLAGIPVKGMVRKAHPSRKTAGETGSQ